MSPNLIYIAFGSNLATPAFPEPLETVKTAIDRLGESGLTFKQAGRFYTTEPVPKSDQPWYINTVVAYETKLDAHQTLAACHALEASMGRERSVPNAARVIDIDLIDFAETIIEPSTGTSLTIPHPRMHQRAFVLRPLADIDPDWRHPVQGSTVRDLIADLPEDQALGQGIRLL